MGQPVPGAQTSEGQNHMQQAITQVMQLDTSLKQNCSILITKFGKFELNHNLISLSVCFTEISRMEV